MSQKPLVYCAVDTTDMDRALALAAAMQRAEAGIKLGLEFYNEHGPQGVARIKDAYDDLSIFLDLKFHDIPNTVAGALRAIASLEPDFVNVHASGGLTMMKQAKEALKEAAEREGRNCPSLLAVTILTSLDDADLKEIGYNGNAEKMVLSLAALTQKAGLDGIVCSPKEITKLRAQCGDDFALMVPGIRPKGAATGDQKRVMTPQDAVSAGASHLVIGRPITQADDPVQAAIKIIQDIEAPSCQTSKSVA